MHGVNNFKISVRSLLPGGGLLRVSRLTFILYLMPEFGICDAIK